MKRIIITLICCAFAAGVSAQEAAKDTSKRPLIREVMELTNMTKMAGEMAGAMLDNFSNSGLGLSEDILQKLKTEIKKEIQTSNLADIFIPIYERHYEKNELQDLIRFYKTPTGRKMINTMPQVMNEAMQAGEQWGKELGLRVAKRLQEQGDL
ncbi:DUF2059 domain-containing protein [Chitinophaga horti]|uniref:DUF2059 domain-containing protein n=1 Tax=Chitinophaga horti TaxID=2920382 RepID=A0ABY6J1P0_9BACT|nr:DUF2059 domain-containing protein [Chitinophaga horti]UYQ92261.1 DUF2059 domain-containing protein [Chitinophaga horti]